MESDLDSFEYLDGSDTKQYNGQSEVSVDGKVEPETDGKPTTTDKVMTSLTPQAYNRYGNMFRRGVREANDKNGDGIDDFYNHDELDVISNGNDDDDLTKIPEGVLNKIDNLIDIIKGNNLSPKQQAIVLNKIIENVDLTNIPYSWKKELSLKIRK